MVLQTLRQTNWAADAIRKSISQEGISGASLKVKVLELSDLKGEIREPLLISRGISRNGPSAKVEVSDVGQEAYTKYEARWWFEAIF